jgi:hypothetical protein
MEVKKSQCSVNYGSVELEETNSSRRKGGSRNITLLLNVIIDSY